jgi:SPOR domain
MKHFAFFFALLGSIATIIAQPTNASVPPTAVYTIQLGAFDDNVKQADFEAIRSYAYVYKRDGLVFVGGFPTEESAEPILAKLKAKGYDDAFIASRSLKKAKTVHVIQLASKAAGETVNWKTYAKIGDLYSMPNASQLRIVHGYYSDINDARVKLKEVQNMGFEDAFIKTVKDIQLTPISEFDTGDKKLIVTSEDTEVGTKGIPKSYNDIPTVSLKRKSTIKLQEALKEVGTYGGVIDGQFGKGTSTAFDKAMKFNRRLKSYDELSQKFSGFEGWEDVRLLLTMSREMSIKDDLQPLTADLLTNLPEDELTAKEAKSALDWHSSLWKGLEKWSSLSQYNDQVYTAYKIAYYRALVHLEDYYASKDIRGEKGTAKAVSVIKTLVGEDMQGFN